MIRVTSHCGPEGATRPTCSVMMVVGVGVAAATGKDPDTSKLRAAPTLEIPCCKQLV